MQVQEAQVQELTQDPDNSRSHDRKNLEAIKQSLEAFGQQKPIVIDQEGKVVAGNGTLAAAQELGWKTIQAVVTDLEGAKQTAYAIADNRTAELAAWNDEQLAKSLVSLQNDDSIDEAISGFDTKEIDKMVQSIAAQNEVVEVEIPENVEPVTKIGDLWKLGRHRLLCGDSTKAEDVARLMDGEVADCWITDPPYNIAYEGGSRKRDAIDNDSMDGKKFLEFLTTTFGYAIDHLKPGGSAYIWHASNETVAFRLALEATGFQVRQTLIWRKNNATFCRSDYHWQHEPCLYGWKSGASHYWYADRKQTTVLDYDRPSVSEDHPTMKPVDLIAYQIGNSSKSGQLLIDLFLGSGTTLIAAEQLERRCYGMEIDPAYCDVIIKRWENLTGETAERLEG